MYGFRGQSYNLDLLSPYEMLLHWSFKRINAPTSSSKNRAVWTVQGLQFKERCREENIRNPVYLLGVHYKANPVFCSEISCILLPEHKA